MVDLTNTRLSRSGATSRYLTHQPTSVTVQAREALRFFFAIPSKGGGTTELYLDIGPSDFASIIEEMSKVDRQVSMRALAEELAKQVAEQPNQDRVVAASARQEVKAAAYEKYEHSSGEAEDLERLIYQRVSKLVKDIDDRENDALPPAEAA